MRASPEDPPASLALAEFRFGLPRVGRKQVGYFGLVNRMEESIAFHASLKGSEMRLECETPCHFPKLLVRLLAAHAVSKLYFAALQQPHIPGQQNAPLRACDSGELRIVGGTLVPGIEAEHTEVRCQSAQVPIQYETDVFDVNWFRVRKYLDVIGRCHLLGQWSEASVHRDLGNLSMWNADRLNEMFQGVRRSGKGFKLRVSLLGWKEVVQLTDKTEPYGSGGGHLRSLSRVSSGIPA